MLCSKTRSVETCDLNRHYRVLCSSALSVETCDLNRHYRVLCCKARSVETCDLNRNCYWVDEKCFLSIGKTRVDEYVRRLA